MIAMASCVKLLAVPGPPPGPWDARAWPAENKAIPTGAAAKGDIQGIFRDDAMTISCDEKRSEDTDDSLCRFWKCCHAEPLGDNSGTRWRRERQRIAPGRQLRGRA